MCPTHKAQPFHVTTHQLALQNIVPSFSFKVSHNNIFMHMFKHSKKWVQIIINWLNSLTSKVMGKFGPFISRYSPLPHPGGGAWFSWSATCLLSRRSLPAMTQKSQPELQVLLESTGCPMPNTTFIQLSSSNPGQLVSFSSACFWARRLNLCTIQHIYLVLQSVVFREVSAFCWSTDTKSSVFTRGHSLSRLQPFVANTL